MNNHAKFMARGKSNTAVEGQEGWMGAIMWVDTGEKHRRKWSV